MRLVPWTVFSALLLPTWRNEERREHPPSEQDKITALVPPHPPPQLKRPISTDRIPLSSATVHDMLAAPLTLLGKGFILQDADLYYCITSVVASLQECTFTLQYEDTSYPIEDVSSKAVLQFSIYLIFVLPLLIELKFAPCHSILSKKDGNNPGKCNFSKEFTIGLERSCHVPHEPHEQARFFFANGGTNLNGLQSHLFITVFHAQHIHTLKKACSIQNTILRKSLLIGDYVHGLRRYRSMKLKLKRFECISASASFFADVYWHLANKDQSVWSQHQ
ncbi:hypothetical protein EDD16DRAFT_1522226 [Pisolithus croceorrhizus]|nr:hypothetical protein EDD16DRAFT_1522226 [Pisolithus croceorrhizus]